MNGKEACYEKRLSKIRYEKGSGTNKTVSAALGMDFKLSGNNSASNHNQKTWYRRIETAISPPVQSQCVYGFQGSNESHFPL